MLSYNIEVMRFPERDKPKIKRSSNKSGNFNGWQKCPSCSEMIHKSELEKNLACCPKCDHHFRLNLKERMALLVDKDSFQEKFSHILPVDRLKFFDTESYESRLAKAKEKSKSSEAIKVGTCQIEGKQVAFGAFDFSFMGGSLSAGAGERLTLLIEYALSEKLPLVVVSASGGARMQESIFSLMQMAKTSAALAKLHETKIPFISVLTDPTSGGVTASFASLGDIIIAEPGALICFAGPRVIEQTIKRKLPEGAQTSEFLLKHGMIDCIVKRSQLKKRISQLLNFLI